MPFNAMKESLHLSRDSRPAQQWRSGAHLPLFWQVTDTEKALRRAQSGGREDSQENGAQDLLRRSLPEGTAFSRSVQAFHGSLVPAHISAKASCMSGLLLAFAHILCTAMPFTEQGPSLACTELCISHSVHVDLA